MPPPYPITIHTPVARYNLFVLKVPLNANKSHQTSLPKNCRQILMKYLGGLRCVTGKCWLTWMVKNTKKCNPTLPYPITLFGHIACMDYNADAKRILSTLPPEDWRKPQGRPHITYSRIWDPTISHCLKQWIWHRTGLCGGCGRCTVLHNLELNARNDDDPNCSLERLHTHQTLCHTVLAYVTYHFNGGGISEHSSMLNVTPLWGLKDVCSLLLFCYLTCDIIGRVSYCMLYIDAQSTSINFWWLLSLSPFQ